MLIGLLNAILNIIAVAPAANAHACATCWQCKLASKALILVAVKGNLACNLISLTTAIEAVYRNLNAL